MAKLYIDNHFADNIDIENVAIESHFSKFDFIRQFKRTYGKTPYNYLKKVRLSKAEELLKYSNLSIKEVCFSVGYSSISSFSGLFKKEIGIPPQEFKKAFEKRTDMIQHKPLKYIPGCFAEKNGWKKSNFKEVE